MSDRIVVLSARPSTVDSIFVIDLPRPRRLEVRYTPAFQEYTRQIHSRIVGNRREA